MNEEQFCERAKVTQALADYLDDVVAEADPSDTRDGGATAVLFAIAAYTLYRFAKNSLDHDRGKAESELREEMLVHVERLTKEGWSREKALKAVMKMNGEVAKLRTDDSLLATVFNMIKGASPK